MESALLSIEEPEFVIEAQAMPRAMSCQVETMVRKAQLP